MSLPRMTVKPAHPGADIPDPAHANMPLPPNGAEVEWDSYWIAREASGDIVVVEPGAAAQSAEVAPKDATGAAAAPVEAPAAPIEAPVA